MNTSRMATRLQLGLSALVLMLSITTSPARAGMEQPRDTPAVHAVVFDTDLLQRIIAATNEAKNAIDGQDSLFYLLGKDGKPRSVDSMVAEVEALPSVVAILRRHGFNPRQYVLANIAFANSYMAAAVILAEGEQGWEQVDRMGVTREHVQFCLEHMDELAGAI